MTKVYEATQLPENEWLVLDALVTAYKEGECPCNWLHLSAEYQSLEEMSGQTIEEVLDILHAKGLAGQELATTLWAPTPRGIAVVEFNEKTAYLKDT